MVEKWQKTTCYILMTASTLVGVGYFMFAIFQCGRPGAATAFWEKKMMGQCVKPNEIRAAGYLHAIVNALTDICMALLPIPMISKSRLKRREKHTVYGILGLAAAGSIASVARINWIPVLAITDLTFWSMLWTDALFTNPTNQHDRASQLPRRLVHCRTGPGHHGRQSLHTSSSSSYNPSQN
jgi:hypothetical protein